MWAIHINNINFWTCIYIYIYIFFFGISAFWSSFNVKTFLEVLLIQAIWLLNLGFSKTCPSFCLFYSCRPEFNGKSWKFFAVHKFILFNQSIKLRYGQECKCCRHCLSNTRNRLQSEKFRLGGMRRALY